MKPSFSPTEVIAEVSSVAISAFLVSQNMDKVTASVYGGIVKALIKGVSLKKGQETPQQKLIKVINNATRAALEDQPWKDVPGCQEAIVEGLFSYQKAQHYLLTNDQGTGLCETMREILMGFTDCDVDTIPITDIALDIANLITQGIRNDSDLMTLDTNANTHENTILLREILRLIQQNGANRPSRPHWLTDPNKTLSDKYIERPGYEDFAGIVEKHPKLLLHGMGGLGKTETMRKACAQLHGQYAHVAWIQYTGSLADSLVAQVTAEEIKALPDADKHAAIESLLFSMGKDLLLLVDNIDADAKDDPSLLFLRRLEGAIIITARHSEVMSGFKGMRMGYLEMNDCMRLFYGYSEMEPQVDEPAVEAIIEMAGRHTLALEIIARAAKARRMSAERMLARLQKEGFQLPMSVMTAHSEDMPESMMEQLDKLYRVADVDDNEDYTYILKNFAILPYLPLSEEDTIGFLALNDAQQDALFELVDLGWLEHSDAGFAMHPVVRQVALRMEPKVEGCQLLMEKLNDAAGSGFFEGRRYLPFLQSVAGIVHEPVEILAITYNNLSAIYQALGDAREALRWQLKAEEIREALYPDGVHPGLATTYNNLATIYQALGDAREALRWQLKAKEIREALHPDRVHPDLATAYNICL